jgi:hypothetical protein
MAAAIDSPRQATKSPVDNELIAGSEQFSQEKLTPPFGARLLL